jgi:O-acetyl-ADP-ribose deacetylase (regulator of RNase III)
VIHAVGPLWGDGEEDTKLAAAITGSLRVADELKLASIAFPAISTGIFGFPKERAAGVMLAALQEYFGKPSGLRLVRLVIYDSATITAFEKAWHDHFNPKCQA